MTFKTSRGCGAVVKKKNYQWGVLMQGGETLLSDTLQLWSMAQQKNFYWCVNKASRY